MNSGLTPPRTPKRNIGTPRRDTKSQAEYSSASENEGIKRSRDGFTIPRVPGISHISRKDKALEEKDKKIA